MYARWHLSRKVFPHCDPRPVRDAERSFRLRIPCLGTLGKVRFAINRTIISSSVSSSRWEDGVAREGRAFFLSPRNIERYRVEARETERERGGKEAFGRAQVKRLREGAGGPSDVRRVPRATRLTSKSVAIGEIPAQLRFIVPEDLRRRRNERGVINGRGR